MNYLPTLRAQLALNRGDSRKSLDAIRAAAPYELGEPANWFGFLSLYPVYVRGVAFLASRQGTNAATEFRKILEHRGIALNEPIGALAHLGLARAYRLQGMSANARTSYQDFLTLWGGADPDIPILRQARSESALLQ